MKVKYVVGRGPEKSVMKAHFTEVRGRSREIVRVRDRGTGTGATRRHRSLP